MKLNHCWIKKTYCWLLLALIVLMAVRILIMVFFAGLPAQMAGFFVGFTLPKLFLLVGMHWLARKSRFGWSCLLAFLYVVIDSQSLMLGLMTFEFFWPIHWQFLLPQVIIALTFITMVFALLALYAGDDDKKESA